MDVAELVDRHGLAPDATDRLSRILTALAAEPDPHTSAPPQEWPEVHVADSLAALELPEVRTARRIADIGAGAGFPGLPLAVALRGAQVDLIESAARRIGLIERLVEAAGLTNAAGVRARAEDWAGADGREAYDVACARAVGPLALLVEYAAPLLKRGATLIAWKGARDAQEESAGARAAEQVGLESAEIRYVEPYPGSRNRHLHLYRKVRKTPEHIPRRPGAAAKRPLR